MAKPTRRRAIRSKRNQPLRTEITKDGLLSITIGISTLAFAVQQTDQWRANRTIARIVDEDQFAKDVLYELAFRDEEDGTTLLATMIDAAAETAVDQGCTGVEDVPNPDFEE